MKCSACGFENVDGAAFCSSCGARLEQPKKPTETQPPSGPYAAAQQMESNSHAAAEAPTAPQQQPMQPPAATAPTQPVPPQPQPQAQAQPQTYQAPTAAAEQTAPTVPTGASAYQSAPAAATPPPFQGTTAGGTAPAAAATTLKWYQKTWVIVLFLIFMWPVGIVLTFLSPWKKNVKIIVVILVAALGIFTMSFSRGFINSMAASSSANQKASFYGVTYKVDSSWQTTDNSATSRTYTIDKNNVIFMQATDYTGYDIPASEDYIIETSKSSLSSTYNLTSSLTAKNTTVGDFDACRFDWKMKDDSGTERTMTEYLIFFDDYVVTVTYGGPTSSYSSMNSTYTSFVNSLSTSGDGSFATAANASGQSGLISSGSGSSSSNSGGSSSSGSGSSSSGSGSSGTSSSGTSDPTAAYEARATAFRNSLPSYCTIVTAADMNTTIPESAKAWVYFFGYSDASKTTLVCYGTYFVVDSSATALSEFDKGVQGLTDAAASGNRVDGDDKNLWSGTTNGVYGYMYRKGNTVLTLASSPDAMEYTQTLASQLAC